MGGGEGYDDAILSRLNFSHRGYFPRKQRSTDPLSLFPLPNKNQLHKQAMEKGCLQRKLHFHGSRITHKRRREHATGEIPAYSNISCIKEYKGNKRFQVNNLWQSVHRYYSPKDIPRNFFFFRACVAEKCSRHLLRSINVVLFLFYTAPTNKNSSSFLLLLFFFFLRSLLGFDATHAHYGQFESRIKPDRGLLMALFVSPRPRGKLPSPRLRVVWHAAFGPKLIGL